MKTSKILRSSTQVVRHADTPSFILRNHVLSKVAIGIIASVLITACQRSPVDPLPSRDNTDSIPRDSTNTPPGGTNNRPPRDSTNNHTGDSTAPNPNVPVSVFKSVKISWSAADFQEIQYDAEGIPVQYASQYVANQGTGYVQRWVHQFQYGPDRRLNRVTMPGIGYVQYFYEGDQVVRTEDYSMDGSAHGIAYVYVFGHESVNAGRCQPDSQQTANPENVSIRFPR